MNGMGQLKGILGDSRSCPLHWPSSTFAAVWVLPLTQHLSPHLSGYVLGPAYHALLGVAVPVLHIDIF